jgi:alpha-tubulin suppressor-like RCC1 family protein
VAGGIRFGALSISPARVGCGVATDHRAYCWGSNAYGELGNPAQTSLVPLPVSGGLSFTAISGGGSTWDSDRAFVCGLTTSGAVYCWGNNALGQLGNGSTANSGVPVRIAQ